jgi:hypothetical protein
MTQPVYIYGLLDPRDGRLRYVGRTATPTVRLSGHKSEWGGDGAKAEWMRGLLAADLEPKMIVFDEVPLDECRQAERDTISRYRKLGCDLLNIKAGGGAVSRKLKTRSVMVGGFVPPAVKEVIERIAEREDHTASFTLRRLLEESPRVKRELKNLQTANA